MVSQIFFRGVIMRPIFYGLLAAAFFSFTFVLNRSIGLEGGSWIWSASLRFFFMTPLLFVIVFIRGDLKTLFVDLKKKPGTWLLWSLVGFVFFYGPLCFASSFGPGWLVAGTIQLMVVAGSLLVPFIPRRNGNSFVRDKIPVKELLFSSIILLGIILIQYTQATSISLTMMLLVVIPLVISSFAYPLGNRKMMQECSDHIDTFQRVLGMTIASLPFWLILSGYAIFTVGLPTTSQVIQSLVIAITSGVCATVLLFTATDIVKNDVKKLAAVDATQATEVGFTLLGEILFLSAPLPSWIGLVFVVLGVIIHSMSNVFRQRNMQNKYNLDHDK
jgi:drug/metabolite transporter (DMT)-like permease